MPAASSQLLHRILVEDQGSAGLDRKASRPRQPHGLDRLGPNHRHIETHILIWLGHFDHAQPPGKSGRRRRSLAPGLQSPQDGSGAFDGGIGTFHSLYSHTGLAGDDHGLANVIAGKAPATSRP